MPWQSNGGGGDKPNPWGNRPRGGSGGGSGGPSGGNNGSGGGGGEPPNIDEIIRNSQDRLKEALPGGGNGLLLILLAVVAVWLLTGFYRVESNEQAVVLQFGKYSETAGAGLHWHLPYPIETAEIRGVTTENQVQVGVSSQIAGRGRQSTSARDESQMLTGDENIVDVRFDVIWRIGDLGLYLFNLADPAATVKSVAESVMREQVGKNRIVPIITDARGQLQAETLQGMQQVLDSYNSGILVLRVQIQESQAPNEVKDAFLEVQRAEADQKRYQNEAEGYRESVVPQARGEAERIRQEAEAYAATVVARAQGEAERFKSVYTEYRQARSVTRKRIYLETMEEILAGMDKIILDGQAGSGVVPYLPLDQLQRGQRSGSGGNDNE